MRYASQGEQKHVVVVDASFADCHTLFFLLKMKNCRVSQARNTEEVINWVSIQALVEEPVDLLVINPTCFRQSLALFTEFGLLRMPFPVLIVNRGEERGFMNNPYGGFGPDCVVTVCEPANLPDTLDRLLR